MQDKIVDFCGILNLLTALENAGFPREVLMQAAMQIKSKTDAVIPISFLSYLVKRIAFRRKVWYVFVLQRW